jgi:hypothetical protein
MIEVSPERISRLFELVNRDGEHEDFANVLAAVIVLAANDEQAEEFFTSDVEDSFDSMSRDIAESLKAQGVVFPFEL